MVARHACGPSHRKANTPPIKQLSHCGNTARGTCGGSWLFGVRRRGRHRIDLSDAQAKSSRAACDKVTRRANHFGLSETVSSPRIKNKSLAPSGKSDL